MPVEGRLVSSGGNDLDTLIIGAGAAGLAAGRRLTELGLNFWILEARNRIGGRAQISDQKGYPLDLGCGWLHSADKNPWTNIAKTLGLTVDETLSAWGEQSGGLGFDPEDQAEFNEAISDFETRLAHVPREGADLPASSLLTAGCRWNPLIEAISTYMSGAELREISSHDSRDYADSGVNWRVREGYATAIAKFSGALPVVTNCQVNLIDHRNQSIKVITSLGILSAKTILITIPPSLLATERLKFLPGLAQKIEACSHLHLGIANKLFLAVDDPQDLPRDGHLFGRINQSATGSYHLRPFGRPMIEGFFGGPLARELEKGGLSAFSDFATAELKGLFGSAFASRLHPIVSTSWANDPFSLGSYSYARPGYTSARQILSEPIEDRLYFAGEACSQTNFSTAHGAYLSGLKAADEIIASFKRQSRR